MNENKMMFKQSVFFNENHELNDTGILLYVDALRLNRENDLPDELLTHVANSENDQKRIFEYYEFVKDDDISDLTPHPYFDKNYQLSTPIKALKNRQIMKIAAAVILLLGVGYMVNVMSGINKGNLPSTANNDSARTTPITTPPPPPGIAEKEPPPEKTTNSTKETLSTTPDSEENQPPTQNNNNPLPPTEVVFSNAEILAMQIAFIERKINNNGSTRSESLKVVTPLISAVFPKAPIVFQWQNPVQDSLLLRVFTKETEDSKKELRYKIAPKDSVFTIPEKLTPYLYYWELNRLLPQGRINQVGFGKFLIQKQNR